MGRGGAARGTNLGRPSFGCRGAARVARRPLGRPARACNEGESSFGPPMKDVSVTEMAGRYDLLWWAGRGYAVVARTRHLA